MNSSPHLVATMIIVILSMFGLSACSDDSTTARPIRNIQITLMPTPTRNVSRNASPPTAVPATPTLEPTASQLLLAILTPGAITSPNDQLSCTGGGMYRQCTDQVAQISFDLPLAWGAVTTTLHSYTGTAGVDDEALGIGREYLYQFDEVRPASKNMVQVKAGGQTQYFRLGRDGIETDFGGFGVQPVTCVSDTSTLYRCIKLSESVVLQLRMTSYVGLCELGPERLRMPRATLYIDLPNNPKINGFNFISPASSATTAENLISSMKATESADGCNDNAGKAFDAKVATYLQSLEEGTADADDQQLFGQIKHLAESIKPTV